MRDCRGKVQSIPEEGSSLAGEFPVAAAAGEADELDMTTACSNLVPASLKIVIVPR
jgi:hypothetical protein